MKSSEAKPLSAEELETLRGLFQRWVLCTYPYYSGASEESDAMNNYHDIAMDAESGAMKYIANDAETKKYIKKYGETEL